MFLDPAWIHFISIPVLQKKQFQKALNDKNSIRVGWHKSLQPTKQIIDASGLFIENILECQSWRDLETPLQLNHAISPTLSCVCQPYFTFISVVNLGSRKHCILSWRGANLNYTLSAQGNYTIIIECVQEAEFSIFRCLQIL